MPRPWRPGLDRRHASLALLVAAVVGLGRVFGTRFLAIRGAEADLRSLRAREDALHEEIVTLQRSLVEADRPQVVEREARARLRWGFPNEERIVILRR